MISLESFSAAELLYHNNCKISYQHKYNKVLNEQKKNQPDNELKDCNLDDINSVDDPSTIFFVTEVIKSIEVTFLLGKIFSLEDIRKILQEKHNTKVKSTMIKNSLISYFGEKINFISPSDRKKSILFHSNNLVNVIENAYYHDCTSKCANDLQDSLISLDFGLEDSFCDAVDLKESWENFNLPEIFIKFFSKLFKIDLKALTNKLKNPTQSNSSDILNENISINKDYIKILKMKSLCQVMYSIKNHARKAPQHVMLGLFIYSTTKSKSIITIMNRLGLCISYDEILRIRKRLASFTMEKNDPPIPSHFDRSIFVTTAFDNFDHNEASISGLNRSHDTVIVLFQNNNPNTVNRKPRVSESLVDTRSRALRSILKCQEIVEYTKSKVSILPANYSISMENMSLSLNNYYNCLTEADCIWYLSRMNFLENGTGVSEKVMNQHVPSWGSFNSIVIEDHRSTQKIGYFPVIGAPATSPSTIKTCLNNFVNISKNLEQTYLPVFCDEGVYKITRPMIFENEKEYEKIVLCLGDFHMIKVNQCCIGKYTNNSGIENIFIETNLFGVCVMEQLFDGINYARLVKAFEYSAEALRRLQLKEFLTEERLRKCSDIIDFIMLLQNSFESKSFDECKHIFKGLEVGIRAFLHEFNEFIANRSGESEMVRYNNVLIMVTMMFNLIRADRTGDWLLHLNTVHQLQPVFHALDRTNYLRWSSVYLEDMLSLPVKAPQVHEAFLQGQFTVKRSNTPFTSVATDQALEQSFNKTSKDRRSGVIGWTRDKAAMSLWGLTFHEFLATNNYFKEVTHYTDSFDEALSHHESADSVTINSEVAVQKILDYLHDKNANPFEEGNQTLRNLITGALVHESVRLDILNIYEKGIELYNNFRDERFIRKVTPLTEPVKKNNIPDFSCIPNVDKTQTKVKKTVHRKLNA